LSDKGIIDDVTAYLLRKAYLIYRSAVHRLSLEEKPGRTGADRFFDLQQSVIKIWAGFFPE